MDQTVAGYSLPSPDPSLDEERTDWCALHSLASLKLTLDCVLRDCMIPNQPALVEFPLKTEVYPSLTKLQSPLRTLPPRARLSGDQLILKKSQLNAVIQLYQDHIHELNQGSRAIFGAVRGHRVCLLIGMLDLCASGKKDQDAQYESNDEGEEEEEADRQEFTEYKQNLQQLFEEQLSGKHKVYLHQLGSEDPENKPTALNFREQKQRCLLITQEWLDSLKRSSGCSLLSGLEKVLALTDIDTLLIVMGSRPSEDKNSLVGYVRDKLAGKSEPHLHWVAHQCTKETTDMLFELASDTGAQFHSFSKSISTEHQQQVEFEDTDIHTITAQLKQAKVIISELENIQSAHLSDTILNTLTQFNIAGPGLGHISTVDCDEQVPVSSAEWLTDNSLNASGLNIYCVLAPNAYPQLSIQVAHSPEAHTIVSSVVYDERMPLFTWHDGSQKYLHVDVHLMEDYQVQLEAYIAVLQQRLNWLASGSRVPFGVVSEKSVLLLVECSAATLPFTSQLQNSLRLLLNEQLSHVEGFDIMRIGGDGESCAWQHGFTQQTKETLTEAWAWLLSQSPAGTSGLLSALEVALTGESYNRGRDVGIYMIVNSMPKEDLERICSFLHEKTAHTNIHVHVTYYRHTPATLSHAVAALSFEEGCYANDQELTHCLQQIAKAGRGRFHCFKGPDTVGGDDIDLILEELEKAQDHLQIAGKILENYCNFCKRHVSPPPLPPSPPPPSNPPPLYPRPTTAFLSRMNANSRRIAKSASDSQLSRRCTRQTKCQKRRTKTHAFYLDKGFEKGVMLERAPWRERNSTRKKSHTNDSISIAEWLSKFGLETLGLNFSQFEVLKRSGQRSHKTTYKHMNKKGEVVELYTNRHGLKRYVHRLKQARENYSTKLDELSKGWRQFLGCITESMVLFLIDISSSMTGSFEALKAAFKDLLEKRPCTLKYFNMVAYSGTARRWKESIAPCTDENVATAIQWIAQLRPGGCSCLLHALKVSLESGVNNIYLITDGTADHTHDFLLSQLSQLRMWYGDTWKINTVAFHCSVESSYGFMKQMAHGTGGRYHCYPWETSLCTSHPAHLLQNRFLGDDIQRLVQEIVSADDYLQKASCYL